MAVPMRRPGLEEEAERIRRQRAQQMAGQPPVTAVRQPPSPAQPRTATPTNVSYRPTPGPRQPQAPGVQVSATGTPRTGPTASGMPGAAGQPPARGALPTGAPSWMRDFGGYQLPSDYQIAARQFSPEVMDWLRQYRIRTANLSGPGTAAEDQQYQADRARIAQQFRDAQNRTWADLASRGIAQAPGSPMAQALTGLNERYTPLELQALADAEQRRFQRQQTGLAGELRAVETLADLERRGWQQGIDEFNTLSPFRYLTPAEQEALRRAQRTESETFTGVDPYTGQSSYRTRLDDQARAERLAALTGTYNDPAIRSNVDQIMRLKEQAESIADPTARAALNQQATALRAQLPYDVASQFGADVPLAQARQNYARLGQPTLTGQTEAVRLRMARLEEEIANNPDYGARARAQAELDDLRAQTAGRSTRSATGGITPYEAARLGLDAERAARQDEQDYLKERSSGIKDLRTTWKVSPTTAGVWHDITQLLDAADELNWPEEQWDQAVRQAMQKAPADERPFIQAMWDDYRGIDAAYRLSKYRKPEPQEGDALDKLLKD